MSVYRGAGPVYFKGAQVANRLSVTAPIRLGSDLSSSRSACYEGLLTVNVDVVFVSSVSGLSDTTGGGWFM